MKPGADFVEVLLAQLRRDAKRFASGRSVELNRALDRRPRYLERVKAENLKLHEMFEAMRFLGFTPLEQMARSFPRFPWLPSGLSGFFQRRRPDGPDRSGLRDLENFLSWGHKTLVDDPAPPYRFDLEKQLNALGLEVGPLDVISAADSLFSILARHRPEVVSKATARDLAHSLATISHALCEEGHLVAACDTLDLGFYLDQRLEDFETRFRLYRSGARLAERLGCRTDALWCSREACRLGLLLSSLELAAEEKEWSSSIRRVGTTSVEGEEPSTEGMRDQRKALIAVEPDRRASHWTAAGLDMELGAKNIFSGACYRERTISVNRWLHLLDCLGLAPLDVFRRIEVDPAPMKLNEILQGLKEDRADPFLLEFRKNLLPWADGLLPVSKASGGAGFPAIAASCSPEKAFPIALPALEHLVERGARRLEKEAASQICRELGRAAYLLRKQGARNAAVDFLSAAGLLHKRLGLPSLLPHTYRNAAFLAVDLGWPREAMCLANRAIYHSDPRYSPREVGLSLYVMGAVSAISGEYEVALAFYDACRRLPSDAKPHGPAILSQAIAKCHLRRDRLEESRRWLDAAEEFAEPSARPWRGELLALRAELLSKSNFIEEPLQLLEEAEALIGSQGEPIALALVILQKCQHLAACGRASEASREARKLLALEQRIKGNPRGRKALLELSRSFARQDSLRTIGTLIHRAQAQLMHPNFHRFAESMPA